MAEQKECLVCGKKYKYCAHCNKNGVITTWKNIYCSSECREIFNTCSSYEGKSISQEDAYKKLIESSIDLNTVRKSVKGTVDKIMTYKPKKEEVVVEEKIAEPDVNINEEEPKRRPRRRRTKKVEE